MKKRPKLANSLSGGSGCKGMASAVGHSIETAQLPTRRMALSNLRRLIRLSGGFKIIAFAFFERAHRLCHLVAFGPPGNLAGFVIYCNHADLAHRAQSRASEKKLE
jgi:hypothetical protein